MDDDGTGWNAILLDVWSEQVRDDVVARIEGATVGRRGWLVRVLLDPDGVQQDGWTETAHALVLAAIRDETGADLEALGSQAAWECYEQVWEALTARFADGGPFATVAIRDEPRVSRLLRDLPVEAAAYAGADVTGERPDPLWLAGRLRIDAAGLRAYLALDGGRAPAAVHAAVTEVLARCEA